jgi:hypothetical protein
LRHCGEKSNEAHQTYCFLLSSNASPVIVSSLFAGCILPSGKAPGSFQGISLSR